MTPDGQLRNAPAAKGVAPGLDRSEETVARSAATLGTADGPRAPGSGGSDASRGGDFE
jgi:hypothetical protein